MSFYLSTPTTAQIQFGTALIRIHKTEAGLVALYCPDTKEKPQHWLSGWVDGNQFRYFGGVAIQATNLLSKVVGLRAYEEWRNS
jgi:hypothetical protein